jgi:autotransporter adhesin
VPSFCKGYEILRITTACSLETVYSQGGIPNIYWKCQSDTRCFSVVGGCIMMNYAKSPKRLTGKKLALLALAICMALQSSVTYALEPVVIGKPSKDEKDTRIASEDSETAKKEFKDSEGNVIDATGKIISIGILSHMNIAESMALNAKSKALNEQAIAISTFRAAADKKSIVLGSGASSTNDDAIAIGNNASIVKGPFGIAIGNDARIKNESSNYNSGNIAIGRATIENGYGNLVINGNIKVPKDKNAVGNIVIGNGCPYDAKTTTNGLGNIAIGEAAKNEGDFNVVIGRKASITKGYSLALGESAKVTGSNSGAIGCDAQVNNADGAFAIGNNAIASNKNSFALGSGAVTSNAHAGDTAKKFKISGQDYKFAGLANDNKGTLSIGKKGVERQIQNVAAGDVAEKSTDAINGSQLFATNQAINSLSDGWEVDVNDKKLKDVKPTSKKLNFKQGSHIQVTGKDDTITIAADLTNLQDSETNAVLYDNHEKGKVTLKGKAGSILTNLQKGSVTKESKDAINGSQLFETNAKVDTNTTNITNNATNITNLKNTVDVGWEADVNDKKLKDVKPTSKKLNFKQGNHIQVTGKDDTIFIAADLTNLQGSETNAVLYDSPEKSKVTLKGKAGSILTNLQKGTVAKESTDAINGSQLFETNAKVGTNTTNITNNASSIGNIKTAVDAGWEADVNDKKLKDVKPASKKLNFKQGNHIQVTGKDDTITIATDLTNLQGSETNAVLYDNPEKSKVTLKGKAGSILTNLQKGSVTKESTDAINGSQLFETNAKVGANTTNITNNATNITNLKTTVDAGWEADVNDKKLKDVKPTSKKLNFKQGNHIQVTGKDDTIFIAADLTNLKVSETNAVLYDNEHKSVVTLGGTGGMKLVTLTNVAAGKADTDAVNYGQVKGLLKEGNLPKTLVFTGNSGSVIKNLGETMIIQGTGSKPSNEYSGVNIRTEVEKNGNLVVKMDKNLTGLNSITFNNGPTNNTVSISSTGLNNGGNKITNVAAGEIKEGSTDAVNGGQIHDLVAGTRVKIENGANTNVIAKDNGNGSTTYKVDVNANSTFGKDDKAINVNGEKGRLTVGKGEKAVAVDGTSGMVKAGKIVVDGDKGRVKGLSNTTWDADKIVSGQAATEDQLKAVAGQIKNVKEQAQKHATVTVNAGKTNGGLVLEKTGNEAGGTNYDISLADNVHVGGKDGHGAIGVKDKDNNHAVTIKVDDNIGGHISFNSKDGGQTNIHVRKGAAGVNAAEGDTKTRVVYRVNEKNHELATIDDGMKYMGDSGTGLSKKLNSQTNIKGGVSDASKLSDNNIGVVADGDSTLTVKLAKDLKDLNSVSAKTVTATTVSGDTIKAGDTVTINKNGIDAGSTKVTNILAGDVRANSTDAVNGAQLYETNQAVSKNAQDINRLGHAHSALNTRVNKVGAGAAALAALHPLDFDPNDKWNIATGTGSYRGQHALALGAFYRPDEDTMFNIASELGNGNNMWSVGVSFKFGRDKNNPAGRAYMAKEIVRLKAVNDTMQGEHQNMKAELNELKVKLEQLTKAK